jgi:hypothetical protein
MVVELLKEYTAQLQITFMAACIVVVALRADSLCTWICMVVSSSPTRSNNVIGETGVFQTYSIAFSRFSNFPIAFCNVFSKINLVNNNNNLLRITNAAKTFNKILLYLITNIETIKEFIAKTTEKFNTRKATNQQ